MAGVRRYVRLWFAQARFGLIRELTFRSNFLVKVSVEVLWFCFLLIFYETVFSHTAGNPVASWSREEYLFFVGCYFTLGALIETFFMSNCGEFSDLVRSGDLDFYLLKPIDEQFLLSCREVDWAAAPSILMGLGLMIYALSERNWVFEPTSALLFPLLFGCGLLLAYSFMLVLASTSVWMVRNQSLYEVWWLFTTLMRYPRELFATGWAAPFARFFTYVIPVMLIVSVPASAMVRTLEPWFALYTVAATAAMLYLSRRFFRYSLQKYRSASS